MAKIYFLILFLFTLSYSQSEGTEKEDKVTYIFVNYSMETIKVKPIKLSKASMDSLQINVNYWDSFNLKPGMLKKVTINKADQKYLTKFNTLNFEYKPKNKIDVSIEHLLITFQPKF